MILHSSASVSLRIAQVIFLGLWVAMQTPLDDVKFNLGMKYLLGKRNRSHQESKPTLDLDRHLVKKNDLCK